MNKKIVSILLFLSLLSLCFGQTSSNADMEKFVSEYETIASSLEMMVTNMETLLNLGDVNSAKGIMEQYKALQECVNTLQTQYSLYMTDIAGNQNYTDRILKATEKMSTALAKLQTFASKL